MHQPRPYGLHVKHGSLTKNDQNFIDNMAKRLTNLKQLSGVDSLKMVYDLPDGGYVILQDMGGNFRVIADKPPSETSKDPSMRLMNVPMLFSGVMTTMPNNRQQPTGIRLTEQCRRRLAGYAPNKLPAKDIELLRFTIGEEDPTTGRFASQYQTLYPSMFSGAMAEVVQIVMGYGRQDISNLPNNPLERAMLTIPKAVQDKIAEEIGTRQPLIENGYPQIDGKVVYDYRFNHTHAVAFDADNQPWLIKIDRGGVWAMPLPRILATTTQAFRAYIDEVGDDELLAILDRFGGMPSGESFPTDSTFDAWVKAGVIVKVSDVADFYQHIAYSTAVGWSLNLQGDEGYNTCYDYEDSTGIGIGYAYKLKLRLKPIRKKPIDEKLNDDELKMVNRYLGIMSNALRTKSSKASLFKLMTASENTLFERATKHQAIADEVDYWNDLVCDPIAPHTGNVALVARGYLYHSAKFEFQPQIKFPEPILGACLSHDFLPVSGKPYDGTPPNCDTIMFAYYIGNTLHTVKYFVDWRTFLNKTVSNFEPYMYVGDWESHTLTGQVGIQGYFYTTDIDEREEVAPSEILTTIQGEDKGYDKRPQFYFVAFGSMNGIMFRQRYYTHLTKTNVITGKNNTLAICIPLYCRNAVLCAKRLTMDRLEYRESLSLEAVTDPNYYRYWTYDFLWAWFLTGRITQKGKPYPKNGHPVWVEEYEYAPNEANAWADNGDWVDGMPADYTWAIHPDPNKWEHSGGGTRPNIQTYDIHQNMGSQAMGKLSMSAADLPLQVHQRIPEEGYFRSSPDKNGNLFRQDGNKICFGNMQYVSCSDANARGERGHVGFSRLTDYRRLQNFIGVINE
ncbi:hypothetical protein ACF3N0_08700 [Moraxella atlantae]|uniref:hypothetical protein n=1 Tax=Faucicola atlantae TaxID=34059 RepID=UPI003750B1AD